jgi:hypothetical protein
MILVVFNLGPCRKGLVTKQSDQDDDRDGNAEKEKQNGTHRKTPCYLFSGCCIALARLV